MDIKFERLVLRKKRDMNYYNEIKQKLINNEINRK